MELAVISVDDRKKLVLEFVLTGSDFNTAGEASSKIKRVLQQIGVAADVIRRIAIAAYEAEMNVIIHANSGLMRAHIFSDHIELHISDKGPGIADISLAMKEGYSTAPDFIREMGFGAGMGLPNMRRCSDKFEINSRLGEGAEILMVFQYQNMQNI